MLDLNTGLNWAKMQVMTELWIILEAPGDNLLPNISQHLKAVHPLWSVLGAALI